VEVKDIMNEEDLRTIVIRDLHAKGINVINFKERIPPVYSE